MPPIVTSAEIDRPAAEVFAVATDPPGSRSGRKASSTGTWTAPASRWPSARNAS